MHIKNYVTLLVLVASLFLTSSATAHYKPGVHNQEHAIVWAFCGHQYRDVCKHGADAIKVARQESSAKYWYTNCAWARNGQYLGCFQMGESERRTYGHSKVWPYHGNNVWSQAQAAHRYFVASGSDWSPWECKPWGCGW